MKRSALFASLLVVTSLLSAQTLPTGTYQYDGAGNIVAIVPNAYQYDALGRLAGATVYSDGTPHTQQFTYDAYGNMTSRTTGTVTTTIQVNANTNRLLDVVQDAYDEAGNLRVDGAIAYDYDSVGQMSHKTFAPQVDEYYIYDASDERIAVRITSDTWRFTFRDLDGKPTREFRASATTNWSQRWNWIQDWVWRDGRLLGSEHPAIDGARRHYHLDHLGSPRLATSTNGLVVARHDYYPYGVEITPLRQEVTKGFTQEQAMKFTGHERDFTSGTATENTNYVDYMHARSYSPNWSRFLSVDSALVTDYSSPQRWNRYAYVSDNPLTAIDPDGLTEITLKPPRAQTLAKWTPEQRAAENLKNLQRAEAAARGELTVTKVEGSSTLRAQWEAANGPVPSGQQIDHIVDRQLSGLDVVPGNAQALDASVNMSNGARTQNAIRGLEVGTKITAFNFTLLSVVNIGGLLSQAYSLHQYRVEFKKTYGRDPSIGEISAFMHYGYRGSQAQALEALWNSNNVYY